MDTSAAPELRDLIHSAILAPYDPVNQDASRALDRRKRKDPDEFSVDLCSLVKDSTTSDDVHAHSFHTFYLLLDSSGTHAWFYSSKA